MRVLVSADSTLIASGTVAELVRRGHSVRLRSPDAADQSSRMARVEAFDGIGGSAGGCDAVIHIGPADLRAMIAEAERESGFRRFAYVTSEPDDSSLLAGSRLGWIVIRHAPVYGPGDEVISPILKIVRTLPIVPVVERGEQQIRPVWYEDLAKAIIALVERRDAARRTFEIAGSESITVNELVNRLRKITARKPIRFPVPHALERIAASFPDEQLDSPLRLRDLGIQETPLDRGLRMLADAQPEQLLDEGIGKLHHKRFRADIRASRYSPEALMSMFRDHVNELMPTDFAAEPGAPSRIERGATLTLALPARGHVQVRVERCDPTVVTFATLEAHPIAGMVEFSAVELPGGAVRFSIDNYSRSGNIIDAIALRTAGEPVQSVHWQKVVQNVVDASGGTAEGVNTDSQTLSEDVAALIEKRLRDLVEARRRADSPAPERLP